VSGALVLRRVEEGDFDAWFELFDEVAREGRWIGADGPQDRERLRPGFGDAIGTDRAARFLAEIDGRLIGELGVFVHAGIADIGMMVRDGHRGTGVGSALMAACLDWCREGPVHKVTLAVFPHNTAALSLYRKFGFVVEGRQVRHYRRRNGELWDAITMGLGLDETAPGSPYQDAGDTD
jgi:RimJ/RimL family protein N-acetyltransferase